MTVFNASISNMHSYQTQFNPPLYQAKIKSQKQNHIINSDFVTRESKPVLGGYRVWLVRTISSGSG
jgi:hypothetical protein